jgi:uncharacterized OB-fold protein
MPVGPVVRDDATAEFFDGTIEGKFLLRRCRHCDTASEPQNEMCPACASTDLAWEAAGGGARVASWAVTHSRTAGEPPTILVIAELDEGPWWWTRIIDADPADISDGQRLQVAFERNGDDHEFVPVFRLAEPQVG